MVEPLLDVPNSNLFDQVNWNDGPVGPSSDSACKVSRGNVCGSGSIVGELNGKTLVLTNAHVAGTKPGTRCQCYFWKNKQTISGRIILAAYSDRIMMDWCVLELDGKVDLPIIKLSNSKLPSNNLYTAGWPRCRGPFFSELEVRGSTHGGTVLRWQPNAIGGQSGSGVHSPEDGLQRALLTWSWAGDGAGQSCRSIWFQYVTRTAYGLERPDDLIELCQKQPDLENGIFSESNITELPIWSHLDDDSNPSPPNSDLKEEILKELQQSRESMDAIAESNAKLVTLIENYLNGESGDGDNDSPPSDEDPTFGL